MRKASPTVRLQTSCGWTSSRSRRLVPWSWRSWAWLPALPWCGSPSTAGFSHLAGTPYEGHSSDHPFISSSSTAQFRPALSVGPRGAAAGHRRASGVLWAARRPAHRPRRMTTRTIQSRPNTSSSTWRTGSSSTVVTSTVMRVLAIRSASGDHEHRIECRWKGRGGGLRCKIRLGAAPVGRNAIKRILEGARHRPGARAPSAIHLGDAHQGALERNHRRLLLHGRSSELPPRPSLRPSAPITRVAWPQ